MLFKLLHKIHHNRSNTVIHIESHLFEYIQPHNKKIDVGLYKTKLIPKSCQKASCAC